MKPIEFNEENQSKSNLNSHSKLDHSVTLQINKLICIYPSPNLTQQTNCKPRKPNHSTKNTQSQINITHLKFLLEYPRIRRITSRSDEREKNQILTA